MNARSRGGGARVELHLSQASIAGRLAKEGPGRAPECGNHAHGNDARNFFADRGFGGAEANAIANVRFFRGFRTVIG